MVDSRSSIIEAIYDATLDPEHWSEASELLMRRYQASSCLINVQDPVLGVLDSVSRSGISETTLRLYVDHYHRVDPWAEAARRNPWLGATLGQELVSEAEYARSEIWNDFARHHGRTFHLLGAGVPISGREVGVIGLHRPREAPAFGRDEKRDVERLLPHIRRALQLRRRLHASALGFAVLDRIAYAVIICTAIGKVIYCNQRAADLASAGDGLILGKGDAGLSVPGHYENCRLRQLIAAAASAVDAGLSGDGGGAMSITRASSGRPPLHLFVAPLPRAWGAAAGRAYDRLALILVTTPGDAPHIRGRILVELYGLTPAEAQLALALFIGKRPTEIARENGVKITTIRSQISSILSKFQVERQSDLVRVIAGVPALR